ncbi:MAG: radical SAM protein [Bacteroidales bacterium]|nr:radical SAM protein [Bacteroidales bacterium]
MSSGIIFSIEEFAINDGPGIRTTVFLKGCPLRCAWCHNPESWKREPQIMVKKGREEMCGYSIEAADLAGRLKRDEALYRDSGGGVTFTGGEPLMQAAFLTEVMDLLPGIHKAVETSGYASPETFREVLSRTDLFLFDIKLADPELHRQFTGAGNAPILQNLQTLIASGKPFVARVPLIPGVNDTPENMEATAELLEGASGLQRVELLRYNQMAGAKYPMVGLPYDPPFQEKQEPKIHDAFTKKGIKLLIL